MPVKNNRIGLKWIFIFLIIAVLGASGFFAWKKSNTKETEYKTVPVTRGDLTQMVTASGQLNPVVTVQVGSQVSGIIQKMFVDFNSPVTNGQVIAQLDPATFQANVHQAEGELANAQAGLELAKVNADRAKKLFGENLLAQSDYDKAAADFHQAEASVQIRQAALERSKVDLERATIYSPIDGIVISREVDVGQTVAASLNAPTLFKIANDLTKMQIDAMVSEADIGGVEVDQDVAFTVDAFPTRTFHGKVQQVRNSPVTVQNVVTYDAVIAVKNEDQKLKPGMTANVSVIIAHKQGALKLPNAALRFRPPETTAKSTSQPTNALQASATNASPATEGRTGSREGRRGGGGNWTGGKGGRGSSDHSPIKTVYIAEKHGEITELKPVQIKTGISDGVSTEVLEGLSENAEVVVGISTPDGDSSRPAANPFGGGSFRRF